jgi:hypothetical protein
MQGLYDSMMDAGDYNANPDSNFASNEAQRIYGDAFRDFRDRENAFYAKLIAEVRKGNAVRERILDANENGSRVS